MPQAARKISKTNRQKKNCSRHAGGTGCTGGSPSVHARMVCAPDLAVTSARFPFADSTLWMATREADAARKDTFLPVDNVSTEVWKKNKGGFRPDASLCNVRLAAHAPSSAGRGEGVEGSLSSLLIARNFLARKLEV